MGTRPCGKEMLTAIAIAAAWAVLPGLLAAQERATTMSRAAIPGVERLTTQYNITLAKVQQAVSLTQNLTRCNDKGATYAPTVAKADADGCVIPISTLEIVTSSASLCQRYENLPIQSYSTEATCPAGYQLLSCSGGEGDMDESFEGSFVRPNATNTGCQIVIGQPACIVDDYWTHSWVFAHCGRVKPAGS